MIHSFANKETEEVFHGIHTHGNPHTLPSHLLKLAEEKLDLLNGTNSYESLVLIPSIGTKVKRDAKGECTLPIQDNWRIVFHWTKDGADDVEIKS